MNRHTKKHYSKPELLTYGHVVVLTKRAGLGLQDSPIGREPTRRLPRGS